MIVPLIVEDTVEVVQFIHRRISNSVLVDQAQIIAGETTQNIVEFPSVLEQVKIQEFP